MSDSCQDLPNIKQNYNRVDIFREKIQMVLNLHLKQLYNTERKSPIYKTR